MGDLAKAPESKLRAQTSELLRFVVVGGSAVGVDFIVYFALVTMVPVIPTSIAKGISFIAGACLAFFLNRSFVFRSQEIPSKQVVPFIVLYLVSLGLNNAVNAVLLAQAMPKVIAWLAATGTSTISNFLGMKFMVFRKKSERE